MNLTPDLMTRTFAAEWFGRTLEVCGRYCIWLEASEEHIVRMALGRDSPTDFFAISCAIAALRDRIDARRLPVEDVDLLDCTIGGFELQLDILSPRSRAARLKHGARDEVARAAGAGA